MPYFVYKIFAKKQLELVEEFAKYRDAKDRVRSMRAALAEDADHNVRLIHAKHPAEAERLLTQTREPRPLGEDA